MITTRKIITMLGLGAGLLAALILLLGLASPAKALQPLNLDQPLVWNAAAPIPEPRAANLVQCPEDPEGFYLVGGIAADGSTPDTLYYYNAATNMWTTTLSPLPAPVRGVALACYQGKIYVAGGWDFPGVQNTFFIYDIAADSWATGPSLPDSLWVAAMGAWDGSLYLIGGSRVPPPLPWTPVDRVDIYDIASGVWTPGGGTPMPVAASLFGAAQRGPYLYAVGGFSGDLNNNLDTTQRYDMSSDSWEMGSDFTSRRAVVPLSLTGSRLYAQGGDMNGGGGFDYTDLVEYLDISNWPNGAWTNLDDPLPVNNWYPAGACTEAMTGGEIWAVGGQTPLIVDTNLYRPAEPCLGYTYTLALAPDSQSGEGYRGGMVDYTLTVTNTGDTPDAYTGLVTSTWTTTISGLGGALDPGQGRSFTVTVEVPYTATLGASDLVTLTLTSQGDPTQTANAVITTTAVTDWVEAASIPERRAANLVQCLEDPEGFYLVGGIANYGTPSTLYHYDAISNTWDTSLAHLPQPRRAVGAACYQGKIYVAGGWDSVPKDSFYIYDIVGDSWSIGPSLPNVLWGAALGAWDGRLYLVGGTRGGFPYHPVNRVDVYDIASGSWTPGGGTPMLTAAGFFGATQRGPYLFAVGGFSGDLDNNLDTTQRYDMSSDTWMSGPEFTSRRVAPISMTGARLYAQGGDLNGGGIGEGTDLVEYLELSNWPGGAWTDLGDPLPQINRAPAGACTEAMIGGEIWAVGGVQVSVYTTNLYRPAEPCLGYNYALSLAPDAQSGEGYRGETVDYTLTVTNTGDTPDAYTPSFTSTWTTTVSGLGGALDPGQGRSFTVTVEIPVGAALGASDLATLTLTSQGDPMQAASAAITTTAVPRYGLILSPAAAELAAPPGALVAYTLQLSNTGEITDTYSLAAGEAGWTVTLPMTETTLAPGDGIEVIVHVAIPADALDGAMDIVTITVTSQGDPLEVASSTLTTTAVWWKNYLPLISTD